MNMSQNKSKSRTPPPLCLRDCLIYSQIEAARFHLYSKRTYDDENIDIEKFQKNSKRKSSNKESPKKKRTKGNTSMKRHSMLLRIDDGQIRDANFKDSSWLHLCISYPPEGKRLNTIFRRLFRVPHSNFLERSN